MISIKNISGQTFNIGDEYNISIKNLVSMISNHMNVKIKIEKDNKRLRPKKARSIFYLVVVKKHKNYLNGDHNIITKRV